MMPGKKGAEKDKGDKDKGDKDKGEKKSAFGRRSLHGKKKKEDGDEAVGGGLDVNGRDASRSLASTPPPPTDPFNQFRNVPVMEKGGNSRSNSFSVGYGMNENESGEGSERGQRRRPERGWGERHAWWREERCPCMPCTFYSSFFSCLLVSRF
jgi:hypothetical protein